MLTDLNVLSRLSGGVEGIPQAVTSSFQPDYPLMIDLNHGPFKPVTNHVESIQRNFEFLLLTNPGEWPFDPNKGVGLLQYLFEPARPEILASLSKKIESKIKQQLERYLSSVELISAEFSLNQENTLENQIGLKLVYVVNREVVAEQKVKVESGAPKMSFTILNEWKSASHNRDGILKTIQLISDMEEI